MLDIKDAWTSAFQNITKQGVLAREEMRNVRFNVKDTKLCGGVIHRGGG